MNYRKGETLIETILSISIILILFLSFNYIYVKNILVINKIIEKIDKNILIENTFEIVLNSTEDEILKYDGYKVDKNLFVVIKKIKSKEYDIIIGKKIKKKSYK